jgi:hypothetical protein
MALKTDFLNQVKEIIEANGWENLLVIEILDGNPDTLRIRLGKEHPIAAMEVVNDYTSGVSSLEQVQQECLRALRTGRPGA